jgi:hypothetical protein
MPALHSPAATVSWAVDSGGTWTTPANWSTSALPTSSDDVTLDRPNGTYTITVHSGTQSINSLTSNENLTVTGGTLAVATTAQIGGSLTLLNGGTLAGGTWTTTGNGTITATGTLNGVTLGGNLTISGGMLLVTNGLTLTGGNVTFSFGSSSSSLYFTGSVKTISGTGTILLGSNGSIVENSGALTIAPGITIANTFSSSSVNLGYSGVNHGTISSQIIGRFVNVTGTNWINAGTLSASNGGTLTLNGSWSNTGTLNVGSGSAMSLTGSWSNLGAIAVDTGGKLTLGGTFTPASIENLTNNGTVAISGTLNNTGNTLTLADGTGNTFSLSSSGTIVGGTVNAPAGGTTSTGTLSGVILGGRLTVPGGTLQVTNGLTLDDGTIALAGTSATTYLDFNGSGAQTLGGTGTILLGSSFNSYINSSGTLTIAPSVTIANSSNSGSVNLGSTGVNQGTISSQINDRGISVTGTNWINAGMLSASNGGTLSLSGSWTNTGTINVGTGGTVTLGGTFTTASIETLTNNGTVAIRGTLYNTGNALTLDGNAFSLAGGAILGGTVNTTSGGAPATGTLIGVTLGGSLTVPGGTLSVNGLTLDGGAITLGGTSSSTYLNFIGSGAQTLDGTGIILFGGTASASYRDFVTNGYPLTISPGVVIATSSRSGSVNLGSSGVSQGTISSQISGREIYVTGTNWTNAGTLSASNGGTLSLSGAVTNTGTIFIDSSSTLVLAGPAASNPNGVIDLSGIAIFNYTGASSADTVRQQLALGRAGVTGIILPEAASNPALGIGYAEASFLLGLSGTKTATWSGQTVDATTLLLKPTLNGDANLDGVVDADDYALLDRSFVRGTTDAHWTDGDFDYSGVIDAADYLLIDSVFGRTHGFSPAFLAERESRFGGAYVSELLAGVPEPSFLAVLSLPVLAGGRRRRCR